MSAPTPRDLLGEVEIPGKFEGEFEVKDGT